MRDKKKIILSISAMLAFLAAIILPGVISDNLQNSYNERTYEQALYLIDNDSFSEAKTELEKIKVYNYKDTNDLIKLCDAHISYEGGRSGAYMSIEKLKFEYQTKERMEKINAFIQKSQAEYEVFFDNLKKQSNTPKSTSSTKSTGSTTAKSSSNSYKSKSYSSKSGSSFTDKYNAKDYKFAEDFYEDHYDDFFDYYDAENYFNKHND